MKFFHYIKWQHEANQRKEKHQGNGRNWIETGNWTDIWGAHVTHGRGMVALRMAKVAALRLDQSDLRG